MDPPALPLPKRIPRRGDNKSAVILREKPSALLTEAMESDRISISSEAPSKPFKPVPRPRTSLIHQNKNSDDSTKNSIYQNGFSESEETKLEDQLYSTNQQSMNSDIFSSSAVVQECEDGYLQFTKSDMSRIRLSILRESPEVPASSQPDVSISPEVQSSPNSPRNRSASDGSGNGIERSSFELIKWESVGSFGNIADLTTPDDSEESNVDVWSVKEDLDTIPPGYTPPPRPESVLTVPEGQLIAVDPPPLPPRPPRTKNAETERRTSLPPIPVTAGSEHGRKIATIHSGNLIVKHSFKDMGKRWCVLKDGKFNMFLDKKAAHLKTTVVCSDIVFVDAAPEKRIKFGFDILVSKTSTKPYSFTAESTHDLNDWICTLAKSICDASSMYDNTTSGTGSQNFDYGGRLYIKHGATGPWCQAWAEVLNRRLTLFTDGAHEEFDLRKAIGLHTVNVEFYTSKEDIVCPFAVEDGKPFVLNMPGRAIYIQSDTEKVTLHWMKLLHKKAKECGSSIEEQPLTTDDVPVILEKCMQFVSAHGLNTEGIYRHNGVSSRIAAVLDVFNKDPHACHLSRDHFSEHDVAGALKRFLRNMPEPLIKFELYQPLLHSSEITDENLKLLKYKTLLNQLSGVNYATLKKLLGHLRVVSENSKENLMTVQNIAASFGSTLMSGSSSGTRGNESFIENDYNGATREILVMMDFLSWYEKLFDDQEMQKERKIMQALKTISEQLKNPPRAGDFLMEIFWEDRKSEGVNAPISTKLTAGELCKSLQEREKMAADSSYSLHELIHDEKLWRPVHYSEEVIPIIMRWTAWNESNISNFSSSYLCIRKNLLYKTITANVTPLSISQQVKFAREKSFKKVTVEFSRMKLTAYKSTSTDKELESWKIEDIIWFVGCSPQRSPPSKFCFTFIEKDGYLEKLKQHRAAFGYTVSCETEDDLNRWLAVLFQAQWDSNLFQST